MNRFNLTFSGEILPGQSPDTAKLRFAEMFEIKDSERLEKFFSGEPVILRRNLDRKAAAECFQELQKIGVAAALVKTTAQEAAEAIVTPAVSESRRPPKKTKKKRADEVQLDLPLESAADVRAKKKEKKATKLAAQEAAREAAQRKQLEEQQQQERERKEEKRRIETQRHKLALENEERARQEDQLPSNQAMTKPEPASTAKRAKSAVKSNLELPRGKLSSYSAAQGPAIRKRQPGEPNLYALAAFRNSPSIRNRAQVAMQRAHKARLLAIASAISLIITLAVYLQQPPASEPTRLIAIAVDQQQRPTLLTNKGLALHDRAGVSAGQISPQALGLTSLLPPVLSTASGQLVVGGYLADQTDVKAAQQRTPQLLRCDLERSTCAPLEKPAKPPATALNPEAIAALTENPIDGTLLGVDGRKNRLFKATANGEIVATAPIKLAAHPRLILEGGLLLMNSATAPAISVYRYDDNAFGKQLDEILLLPPAAMARKQSEVYDFARTGETWWAALRNPETGATNLYRFDAQWNYLGEVETGPLSTYQLTPWGERLLIPQENSLVIQRFNAFGEAEIRFSPSDVIAAEQFSQQALAVQTLAWRSAIALLALLVAIGISIAWLQRTRALVYGNVRERGAPPLEDVAEQIQWIPPAKGRLPAINRLALAYTAVCVALVLLSISQTVNAWTLAALLVSLCGPAIALVLIKRSGQCHVGVNSASLTLVDHRGIYHIGSGSQIAYRGSFMLLDDIVVNAGSTLLPAFDLNTLRSEVKPLVVGGVRVDRKTLIAKLLEAGHPFARGAVAIGACAALGIALWLTGGV